MTDTLTITLTDEEVYLLHKILSKVKDIPEDDLSVVLDVETRLKKWLDKTDEEEQDDTRTMECRICAIACACSKGGA